MTKEQHDKDCDLRLYGNDPGVVIECTCRRPSKPQCGCTVSRHPGHQVYHRADCWVTSLVGAHSEIEHLQEQEAALREIHREDQAEIERRRDEVTSLQQEVASLTRTLEAAREASGNIAASNLRLTRERDEALHKVNTLTCEDENKRLRAALERIDNHEPKQFRGHTDMSEAYNELQSIAGEALRPADET